MKVLVDKLPNCPVACMFHSIHTLRSNPFDEKDKLYYTIYSCTLDDSKAFECTIGSNEFKCPYLKEFKASAEEVIDKGFNIALTRKLPVELDD